MKMIIAIPLDPEYDETEAPNEEDSWDMLMCDLRDDVEHVHLMPSWIDTNPRREVYRGIDAWVYRFDVAEPLRTELLSSAYANRPDLIIEEA